MRGEEQGKVAHRILSGQTPARSLRMRVLGMTLHALLRGGRAPGVELFCYPLHPKVSSPQVGPSYVLVHVDVPKVGADLLGPFSRVSTMVVHGVVRVMRVTRVTRVLLLLLVLAERRGWLLLCQGSLQDG